MSSFLTNTFNVIILYHYRLLRVEAVYCNLTGAQETYKQTLALIDDLNQNKMAPNLAGIYADFSVYFFIRSEFDDVSK